MAKKTHEEYVKELAIKRPDIEVVGKYIDAKTKIEHRCLRHDVCWLVRPDNVLHGRSCSECAKEGRIKHNGITREEYAKKLSIENPTIEIVGEYINAKTKTLHHCLKHDVYYDAVPDSVLNKRTGCIECAKEKFRLSMTKTQEEYIAELSAKNPDVELVGEYEGYNTPVRHYCKMHDILFNSRPADVLRGSGCGRCKSDKMRMKKLKTEEEYIAELEEKNPFVKLVGKYHDSLTPTKHLCLTHNIIWCPTPARVLSGGGCSKCRSEKISNALTKTRGEYIAELLQKNPNIELVGEYFGYKIPTKHYCKIHNEEFTTSPQCAIKGCGCLHCSGSKGEKYISEWLNSRGIIYETQKSFDGCKDKHPLLFDFYLSEYNLCIEYDGKQHYEPIEYFGGQKALEYTQRHDKIKTDYCKNNNINLLRISYNEDIEEKLNNSLFI